MKVMARISRWLVGENPFYGGAMHSFWNHTMLDIHSWCGIETNVMEVSFGKSDVLKTFLRIMFN